MKHAMMTPLNCLKGNGPKSGGQFYELGRKYTETNDEEFYGNLIYFVIISDDPEVQWGRICRRQQTMALSVDGYVNILRKN